MDKEKKRKFHLMYMELPFLLVYLLYIHLSLFLIMVSGGKFR